MPHKNARRAPTTLASGRQVAPGERVEDGELDPESAHDAALLEEGALVEAGDRAPADDGVLRGEALDQRARELDVKGRSGMDADELRAAVAEAEARAAAEADVTAPNEED